QASWNTGAADFITASGITLNQVTDCDGNAAAFGENSDAGDYCVDGQRLLINVGKDNTTNARFTIKAQHNTVADWTDADTTADPAAAYRLRNTAAFHYRDGGPHRVNRDSTVTVLEQSEDGYNDPSAFTKNGEPRDKTVSPGQSTTIDYRLKVAGGDGIDVRT